MSRTEKSAGSPKPHPTTECKSSECGVVHSDCPNTWKGSCDREAGHSASHHCSACNSLF